MLRVTSHSCGTAVQESDSIIAIRWLEIPRMRKGDSILLIPRVNSSGEVVRTNSTLAIIKNRIRAAKIPPAERPSFVISMDAIVSIVFVPELKNRGNKKETNIREAYFLSLPIRNLNGVREIKVIALKKKKIPR